MAAQLSGTSVPSRIDFDTTDAEVATDYYPRVYRTPMTFRGLRDGVEYTHSRLDAGLFAIDEVQLPRFEVALDPFNSLIVVNMHRGRFGRECAGVADVFGDGDVFISADPSRSAKMSFYDTHFWNIMLDLSVLAQVATTSSTRTRSPIRFTAFRPISRRAATNWKRTTTYIDELVANTEAIAQPLIRGAAARLLAAGALTTFPNTALTEPTSQDRRDATRASIVRATAFIERNPDRDISVAEIADAAHVSIRAVQVAFRRHLDTTPMHYLRDVRLDHVHRELLAAQPGRATVTEVAARWGFHNHSRFADCYRRAYGVNPRVTLRSV
jgi:AraC-like DNA-binding protein